MTKVIRRANRTAVVNEADPLHSLNERGRCPDCGGQQFIEGPHGGASVNIKCAKCGSKFWYAPPFTPQRIDNDDRFYTRTPRDLGEI